MKTSQVSLDVTTCGLVNSYRRFKDRSLQDQVASLLGLFRSEDEGTTLFRNGCNNSQSTRCNIPHKGLLTKHRQAAITPVLLHYRPAHNRQNILTKHFVYTNIQIIKLFAPMYCFKIFYTLKPSTHIKINFKNYSNMFRSHWTIIR